MASKREAVKHAQVVLQTHQPGLKIDGVWGAATEKTFVSAPRTVQAGVNTVLSAVGFSLADVRAADPTGQWISEAEARSIATRAALRVGVSPDYLLYLLELEPRRRIGLAGREYDVMSLSPSKNHRGLFQVGAPAWDDARAVVPEIGSYDANWRDPMLNALAAAGFAKRNTGYARDIYGYKGPLSNEIFYAMHNQGHTFLKSVKQGGIGYYADGQSSSARQVLKVAAQQARTSLV